MSNADAAVAFIGGGNMAQAIIGGAVDAGVLAPSRVVVAEPDETKRGAFPSAVPSASEALAWLREREEEPGAGQIVLAVKPQSFPGLAGELRPVLESETGRARTVISILAGTRSETIRAGLGGRVRVVRTMPNTPARVRRGVTAVALGAGAEPGDDAFAAAIFEGVGRVVRLEEPQIDAFTGVAGSGPAYVFLLAEAMASGGVRAGLDAGVALAVARETVAGSGALLGSSDETPEALRRAVTSPGGTTAAAVAVLEEAGVPEAVARAVCAARDRGAELAGGAG